METQLAEELGVSRTPIREALRRLELEGFIVMMPRKGAHVADAPLARQVAQEHIENAENNMMESLKKEGLPK